MKALSKMIKILILLVSLTAIMADEFITLEPGFYKEIKGDMKIEENTWNMVISYDIKEIDIKITQVTKVFNNLKLFCSKMEKYDVNSCKDNMNLANDLLNRLENDKERIFDLFGKSKSKRG